MERVAAADGTRRARKQQTHTISCLTPCARQIVRAGRQAPFAPPRCQFNWLAFRPIAVASSQVSPYAIFCHPPPFEIRQPVRSLLSPPPHPASCADTPAKRGYRSSLVRHAFPRPHAAPRHLRVCAESAARSAFPECISGHDARASASLARTILSSSTQTRCALCSSLS